MFLVHPHRNHVSGNEMSPDVDLAACLACHVMVVTRELVHTQREEKETGGGLFCRNLLWIGW